MKRLSTTAIREGLSDILNQVTYAKERVILNRRCKDVADLVSMEDLILLQALEDKMDNEAESAALEEPGASKDWEQVKKDLGLIE